VNHRVFVVVGAKGGVGASMIATKLVEELPATGERVIVDADLTGKRSHAVWYDLVADLDFDHVPGSPATAMSPNGIIVKELARTYEDGFTQSAPSILASMAGLANALIIVDAPQPFASTVRPFIVNAERIVVVTEPTLLGLAAARAMLSAMNRRGIDPERIAFVLNDSRNRRELPRSEIETQLCTPVSVEIPIGSDRRFSNVFSGFAHSLAGASE